MLHDLVRTVMRHPVLSLLAAITVLAGVGAVIDSLSGPASSGAGSTECTEPVRQPKGQQQVDATLEYRLLWRRAAPLLGSQGKPPPRLKFIGAAAAHPGPREAMWAGPDASNCRTIFIAPGARKLLGNPGKTSRDRRHHRAVQRWALHETAHYFQSAAVLSNASLREYGATEWEKAHSGELLGARKGKAPPPFNQWRDRDQFGPQYGGNPLTFLWPAVTEAARPDSLR
jgi:hypothetical protein